MNSCDDSWQMGMILVRVHAWCDAGGVGVRGIHGVVEVVHETATNQRQAAPRPHERHLRIALTSPVHEA